MAKTSSQKQKTKKDGIITSSLHFPPFPTSTNPTLFEPQHSNPLHRHSTATCNKTTRFFPPNNPLFSFSLFFVLDSYVGPTSLHLHMDNKASRVYLVRHSLAERYATKASSLLSFVSEEFFSF
jgi:hypothetical protein